MDGKVAISEKIAQSAHVDCGDCPIRHRAVCARCEADELELLEQIKYYRNFEAGQTVIWSGDQMDFVASVVSGIATLTQTMEDGRTQMVGLLLTAVARNAWTFAGDGAFSATPGDPCVIVVRGNPLAQPGCPWHSAVFEVLFRRLVAHGAWVSHTACQAEGDDCCAFRVALRPSQRKA
jgi:hypothetical protein